MLIKKNIQIALMGLFCLVSSIEAQQVINNRFYGLGWDNDVFMMTDHYYTQGLSFSTYAPFFKQNPVNLILLKPKGYNKVLYGFAVDQRTYTPKDISSDQIQFNDRPYAGVLVFTSKSSAANTSNKLLFKSELDIGVMGPASGAGQVQYHYHNLTNNPLPNGWNYQQYNWPIVNYNVGVTQELFSNKNIEGYGLGNVRLGTLHNDVSVGALFRFGMMNHYVESLGLHLPSMDGKNWQYFVAIEPSVRIVGYNATMQGGWYRNPKIHYIDFDEMNLAVGRLKTGFSLMYKTFGLSFDVIYNTKEFKDGSSHWYNSTRLFLVF